MGLEGGVVGRSSDKGKMIAVCEAGSGRGGKPVASSPAPLLHTPAILHAHWPEQMDTRGLDCGCVEPLPSGDLLSLLFEFHHAPPWTMLAMWQRHGAKVPW